MKDPRFPELSAQQIRVIEPFAKREHYPERSQVFTRGQSDYDFFVILDGSIRIEDPTNNDALIVDHGRYEFSGDAGMLSSRVAQFHAFTTPDTTLLRISPRDLKRIISEHSDISDLLLNAFLQRQHSVLQTMRGGLRLVGSGNSAEVYKLRDFMEKNHVWHQFTDIDRDQEAKDILSCFGLTEADLPIIIGNDQKVCVRPNITELARTVGVLDEFDEGYYDVLVIGAGPAGLAASVYAASEGLSVVTIDSEAPGGQAGKSSKIENYLGFPMGISGNDLAHNAYVQAQKFGCHISIPRKAKDITYTGLGFKTTTEDGAVVLSRSVIIATGAQYRRLPIDRIQDFEGRGVFYSATGMDVRSCAGQTVAVIGGGNSAGQAALFLAEHAKELHIMIRGSDLGAKMSDYLVQRIHAADNIHLHTQCQVEVLHGDHHLEHITVNHEGSLSELQVTQLFSFIGARPCTDWMQGLVKTDERGFIRTGLELEKDEALTCPIYSERAPQALETSMPGLFAVGDVRSGSVKRVASAVGEGSMAVSQVHRYLAEVEQLQEAQAN